ncbi:DUF1801 domain-containing protein [Cytophagales bacterium LB-30]|uniref:DUF1801 domain-containing protein n=1 Tax=Shiella aurantiaca TaxID=3058365 RepID=A0ABT8F533_9BACT|nr:DUF1801 domain-containing protein [Shiella aurantiaca]MDN4165488.1 DUF1801 domain-containing protein [Shiella aurantiaca]
MAKEKLSAQEQVTEYIEQLPQAIRPAVAYLRERILSVDAQIGEHIKWNAPAFYYTGEMKAFDPKTYKRDILVMHLRKAYILCVLPTGASIQKNTALLEGDYTDGRRMISFRDLEDIKSKEALLKDTLQEWLSLVEKE